MRLRLTAVYRGVPYQVGLGPDGTQATLLSPGPPPAELGFTTAAGHWRKQVALTDLDSLWLSRPVGEYQGEPCLILDDLGDRLHIAYLGRDSVRAAQLGYWEIDREVFEVVVARDDVTGLTEERVEFPVSAAMFGRLGPELGAADAADAPDSADAANSANAAEGGPGAAREVAAGAEVPLGAGVGAGDDAAAGHEVAAGDGDAAVKGALAGAGVATGNGVAVGNGVVAGNGVMAGKDVAVGSGHEYGQNGMDHEPRRPDRMTAWHGSPEPWNEPGAQPGRVSRLGGGSEAADAPDLNAGSGLGGGPGLGGRIEAGGGPGLGGGSGEGRPSGRRNGRGRVSPESYFAELLSLADIPHSAYSVGREVPGAMCLVEADGGFEVFSRTDDARLEVHFFADEEAAYFYLFGVLAAEAVRSGRLTSLRPAPANGGHNGSIGAIPRER